VGAAREVAWSMAWGCGRRGILDMICLTAWNVMAERGGLVQARHRVYVCGGDGS